jgi:hypothetical protein
MDENVKQALQIIIHKKMQIKAELEMYRFMEETDRKKSYRREIDERLDRMKELDDLYDKIKNQ